MSIIANVVQPSINPFDSMPAIRVYPFQEPQTGGGVNIRQRLAPMARQIESPDHFLRLIPNLASRFVEPREEEVFHSSIFLSTTRALTGLTRR